jgi:hypothetical protein
MSFSRSFFLLTVLAFSFCALSPQADAKTAPKKKTADPSSSLKAIPVPMNGRFGFCVVERAYPEKRKLTLAMSPIHQINVGVSIADAGFSKGAEYDLNYGFNGKADRTLKARALSEDTVLLQMEVNPAFAKSIDKSDTFDVGGDGNIVSFSLKPMHGAIDALAKCVAANKDKTDPTTAIPPSLTSLLAAAGQKDKNVVIIDDMVDTAGTITMAADIMKNAGAKTVRACASHCVMSGPASERVQNSALEEIVFTDSIPYSNRCAKVKQLSVAEMFAETIRRVVDNKSISSQYIV